MKAKALDVCLPPRFSRSLPRGCNKRLPTVRRVIYSVSDADRNVIHEVAPRLLITLSGLSINGYTWRRSNTSLVPNRARGQGTDYGPVRRYLEIVHISNALCVKHVNKKVRESLTSSVTVLEQARGRIEGDVAIKCNSARKPY